MELRDARGWDAGEGGAPTISARDGGRLAACAGGDITGFCDCEGSVILGCAGLETSASVSLGCCPEAGTGSPLIVGPWVCTGAPLLLGVFFDAGPEGASER